jgi:hypothetical protein
MQRHLLGLYADTIEQKPSFRSRNLGRSAQSLITAFCVRQPQRIASTDFEAWYVG